MPIDEDLLHLNGPTDNERDSPYPFFDLQTGTKPVSDMYCLLHCCILITIMVQSPSGPRPPHYQGFTIALRHTTLGKTPLDERSARRRDLYLTTHNTYNRQTSMPLAGSEPTISASERPQTPL